MAKSITPPGRSCNCGSAKSSLNQYWINKDKNSPYYGTWMIGDESTGWPATGPQGPVSTDQLVPARAEDIFNLSQTEGE